MAVLSSRGSAQPWFDSILDTQAVAPWFLKIRSLKPASQNTLLKTPLKKAG
jgi:hypothetical protein